MHKKDVLPVPFLFPPSLTLSSQEGAYAAAGFFCSRLTCEYVKTPASAIAVPARAGSRVKRNTWQIADRQLLLMRSSLNSKYHACLGLQ